MFYADNTSFLSAVLLYHLFPGTLLQEDLVIGDQNIFATMLQGGSSANLEDHKPQVVVFGADAAGNPEIRNQALPTVVVGTYTADSLLVHEINQIIGLPGSYSYLTQYWGLMQLEALRFAGGAPSLDSACGFTLFAPTDTAFNITQSNLVITDPAAVWNNHVCSQKCFSASFCATLLTFRPRSS